MRDGAIEHPHAQPLKRPLQHFRAPQARRAIFQMRHHHLPVKRAQDPRAANRLGQRLLGREDSGEVLSRMRVRHGVAMLFRVEELLKAAITVGKQLFHRRDFAQVAPHPKRGHERAPQNLWCRRQPADQVQAPPRPGTA